MRWRNIDEAIERGVNSRPVQVVLPMFLTLATLTFLGLAYMFWAWIADGRPCGRFMDWLFNLTCR